MSSPTPPPNTDDASAEPAAPGNRWVKGMKSPNALGRPRGIIDKRSKITKALMDDAPAIARLVASEALEGNMLAASMVLARCAPALRAESSPVEFSFDATAPIPRQIEQVLEAMAAGQVPVEIGRQIIDAIGTLANVRAAEDLEARIITLEAKEAK